MNVDNGYQYYHVGDTMKLEDDLTKLLLLYIQTKPSIPVDDEVFARRVAIEIIELVTNAIKNLEFKV